MVDASDRLLDDGGALLYERGIAATGVSLLAERLRISKQTLYERFGSKDDFVAATLHHASPSTLAHFTEGAEARTPDSAQRLVAVFEILADGLQHADFRGCRFLNAAAELPDPAHPARPVIAAHKRELRAWFEHTARRADLRRPRALAAALLMIFDGAITEAALIDVRRSDVLVAVEALIAAHTRSDDSSPASSR